MLEFLPLLSYQLVMTITPGPNNILITASGVNFGYRRTLPQIAGILCGNAIQVLLCAQLLAHAPGWIDQVRMPLAVAGCLYLLWIAAQLARAGAPGQKDVARPMGFKGGLLFQCVNPKAWIMVLNSVLLFLPRDGQVGAALMIAACGMAVGIPSLSVWAWGGERLRRWLQQPVALRSFNACMAGLLACTALYLAFDEMRPLLAA